MSRIRSAYTKPERIVRSILHRLGARFQSKSGQMLPGKPDVVLPKYGTAVFVHGCFWHRHPNCKYAYTPKSRQRFWNLKFQENKARDMRVTSGIRSSGWRVIVIWECETKFIDKLENKLRRYLVSQKKLLAQKNIRKLTPRF